MDITEEITETQNVVELDTEDSFSEEQFKIINYFQEHTGFFVACVSAFVAMMSFVVRLAIGRMNYAYLEYWDIPTLYANIDNQNELHLIVCTLLYILALMLIHALLSKTSSAYRKYNKLLTTAKQQIKHAKKMRRKLRRKVKICSKIINKLKPEEKESEATQKAQRDIKKAKEDNAVIQKDIQEEQRLCRITRKWIILNIGTSIILSFLVGLMFALLMKTTIAIKDFVDASKLIACVILFDLLLYFLPAYLATRCTKKQYEDIDITRFVEEMNPKAMPTFPIDSIVEKGYISIFSDKRVKQAIAQIVSVTILILFLVPALGTSSAKLKEDFPIYSDESGTYAIIYFSDSTVFMEEATVHDRTILIDTSKQRIITTDDLVYNSVSFDNVVINRIEDVDELDQNSFSIKDIINTVERFISLLST